jgi:predicted Ser/Thr protein kinase
MLNNRYRIVKLLGQGGYGAVYRAWDTSLNAPCAVKENFEISPEAARQFAKEASLLANLRHPHLPKVTDHFSIPDQGQYLVMEYIEGRDLQELLDQSEKPFEPDKVLAWIEQVCDALSYLHNRTQPVIHRDIKPANIRITPEDQAVLVDFGIAKIYDPASRTSTAARAVTPGYAPFEQYGQRSTDARTDIYALGATAYHLLTGRRPVDSIDRVAGESLKLPRQLNPDISEHVDEAVQRAMAVMPEERWQSAAEFKKALRQPSQVNDRVTITPVASQSAVTKPAVEGVVRAQPRPLAKAPSRQKQPANQLWKWLAVGGGILAIGMILLLLGGGIGFLMNQAATQTVLAVVAQPTGDSQPTGVTVPTKLQPPPTHTARPEAPEVSGQYGKVSLWHAYQTGSAEESTLAELVANAKAEMPDLEAFHRANQASGFTVLAVNVGEDRATVESFIRANGFDFPVALDANWVVLDQYQRDSLPSSFLIGPDGALVKAWPPGALSRAMLEQDITPLLAS